MNEKDRLELISRFKFNIILGIFGILIGIYGYLLPNNIIGIFGTILIGTAAFLQLHLLLRIKQQEKE
jgi:hypothetical protein